MNSQGPAKQPAKSGSILNFFQIQPKAKTQIGDSAESTENSAPKLPFGQLPQAQPVMAADMDEEEDEPIVPRRLKRINVGDTIMEESPASNRKGRDNSNVAVNSGLTRLSRIIDDGEPNQQVSAFGRLRVSERQTVQSSNLKNEPTQKSNTKKIAMNNRNSMTPSQLGTSQLMTPHKNGKSPAPNTTNTATARGKKLGGDDDTEEEFEDKTPQWALPENALDKHKRPSSHPDYDPTTLYIPPEAFKKLTPTMQQYWKIKSENFDKIILFKLGKFYELFYEDASICVKMLDLNYMGRKQHAGFPESTLERYLTRLVDLGYKAAVVEQTETDRDMKARLKSTPAPKNEKTIRRDLVSIHTKGTMPVMDSGNASEALSCLWSIYQCSHFISLTILHFETGKIGFIQLEMISQAFVNDIKILLINYPPTEILVQSRLLHPAISIIFQTLPHKPQITAPFFFKESTTESIMGKVSNLNGHLLTDVNQLIHAKCPADGIQSMTHCFAQLFGYIETLLLLSKLLVAAQVYHIKTAFHTSNLYLDSQALGHLEVLETQSGDVKGSLYWLVNRCSSSFGKRLLRQWLAAPLADINEIRARLDAIEILELVRNDREVFMTILSKSRDLEKFACQLYKYSLVGEKKIIIYQDLSSKRLGELNDFFDKIMQGHQSLQNLRSVLVARVGGTSHLCQTFEQLFNDLPEVSPIIAEIQGHITLRDGIPIPTPGFDRAFDECEELIRSIQKEAENYVGGLRRQFNCNDINLVQAKARFEIEMPEKLIGKYGKPKDFEFSSRRQNYDRFINPVTNKLIDRLEHQEEIRTQHLVLFNAYIFKLFLSHRNTWDMIIRLLAELDVLCGLSVFCFDEYKQLCRPIVEDFLDDSILLKTTNMKHPVISSINPDFVGNDIEFANDKRAFVLTGPNMGGKSTIMRTLALNVILAQMGCYVFADSFHFSLFDKIFTRIGASDKLEENKSTFFIEMEETLQILNYSTVHSLAIVDELGRGTSTYDGYSIACACLKFILRQIKCRTIFSTHYFFIQEDLEDTKDIAFKRMAYRILQDNKIERLQFIYKMEDGLCEKSFALNVALLAGIDRGIIERADKITTDYRQHIDL
jgi:DNA mismatch repair protein MSH6